MGDVADCFDQETYGSCIPIDPIDGRFPVLGQYIGGVARSHAQRRYCARWRPHDRLFDRIETCENRFDPLCRELIKGVLSNTRPNTRLDRRLYGRMCSRAAISVLIAAQPLHGEQFRGNCVELFFKREQRRIVC